MSALNKEYLGWRYLPEHGDDQRAAVALQCFYLSALAWTSIPLTGWLIRGSLYHLHQRCLWFQGMCKNVLAFLYLPFYPPPLTCPPLLLPDAISSQSAVYLADQQIIFSTLNMLILTHRRLYLSFRERRKVLISLRQSPPPLLLLLL